MEKKWVTWLFFFLTIGSGVMLFSRGISFARWSETHAIDYFIDVHAGLLVIAGVGLFIVVLYAL